MSRKLIIYLKIHWALTIISMILLYIGSVSFRLSIYSSNRYINNLSDLTGILWVVGFILFLFTGVSYCTFFHKIKNKKYLKITSILIIFMVASWMISIKLMVT